MDQSNKQSINQLVNYPTSQLVNNTIQEASEAVCEWPGEGWQVLGEAGEEQRGGQEEQGGKETQGEPDSSQVG